jgi:voltage-gated potassium channel
MINQDASSPEAHHTSLKTRLRIARLRRTIANRPVVFIASYSIILLLVCGVLYSVLETKTSIPDGLYWAIVTAATVGYGDISPVEIEGRLLAAFLIINGVAVAALLTALFATWLFEDKFEEHLGTPDLHDDFDHLIGQLQALKRRYEQDESADDRIAEAARIAYAEWKTQPDGEKCNTAMATLADALKHDY